MRVSLNMDGLVPSAYVLAAALAVSAAGCTEDVQSPMSHEIVNVEAVADPVGSDCCGVPVADPATNGLRLSLVSDVAVPGTDTLGASTAYLVPFESSTISLYDGGVWVARTMSATAELETTSVANTSYDVYAYWSGTDVLLEMEATPVTPTLELQDGVQVKSGAASHRYVGVLVTNASGAFEDSQKNRLVWNRNNQVPRAVNGVDLTSWYYTGNQSTWREVRANAASRVKVAAGILDGSAGVAGAYASVQAVEMCLVSSGTNGAFVATGIGIDSPTINSAQTVELASATTTVYAHAFSSYEGYLEPGIRTLHWLEIGQTGTTFYCIGSSNSPPFGRLGLSGTVVM